MVAQTIHAAGESSPGHLPPHTYAIALSARDEPELLDLERRLRAAAIPHTAVREPDSPWSNALMAIGLPPQPRQALKKHLSRFPLLR